MNSLSADDWLLVIAASLAAGCAVAGAIAGVASARRAQREFDAELLKAIGTDDRGVRTCADIVELSERRRVRGGNDAA